VEEVEKCTSMPGGWDWKAVAIYRDNCKVAQPVATTKRAGARHRSWPTARILSCGRWRGGAAR